MAKPTKEQKMEALCQALTRQVLIVLADYQTTQDSLYFSRNESRRVEVAQRIEDNARLIFGAPKRHVARRL